MCLHPYESATSQSITNHDDLVEVARLVNKTQLLIRALGGLLPGLSSEHLEHLTTVLEIACGPGGWTRAMARAYPQIHITGVDSSHAMIAFARSMLRDQYFANVEYLEIPNFVGPYPFNEASFDLISVQFMGKFLTVDAWPHFLSACWRLLRPGGLFRLTEFEVGLANSPAHEELGQLFIHAMRLASRSFSPSDRHLGLLCELEPLLYAAGFQECFCVPHAVNYSYGAPLHEEWKKDFLIFSREVQPLIIQKGLATQDQVDALHQQQSYEMNLPTFHAILPMLTVWGTKR
jgi:SAM-dependent methyltransferase